MWEIFSATHTRGLKGHLKVFSTLYFPKFTYLEVWEKRYISGYTWPILITDSKIESKSKNIGGVFQGFGQFSGQRVENTL